MSPVGSLAGAYRVPKVVQEAPIDNSTVVGAPVFQWATSTGLARKPVPVHFRVQVATDSGFTTIVQEYVSWIVSGFQWESSPGVWTAIPLSGLDISELGKDVRISSGFATLGSYFWRIRSEQLV
jgi:hypothetical protein